MLHQVNLPLFIMDYSQFRLTNLIGKFKFEMLISDLLFGKIIIYCDDDYEKCKL